MSWFIFQFISCLLATQSIATHQYTFNEELLVEQLPNSYLGLQFQFLSTWDKNLNKKGLLFELFEK